MAIFNGRERIYLIWQNHETLETNHFFSKIEGNLLKKHLKHLFKKSLEDES